MVSKFHKLVKSYEANKIYSGLVVVSSLALSTLWNHYMYLLLRIAVDVPNITLTDMMCLDYSQLVSHAYKCNVWYVTVYVGSI